MKKTLLITASLMLAVAAFSQGTIVFDNSTTTAKALVYGLDPLDPTAYKSGQTATGLPVGTTTYGGALLTGTGFTATLWEVNTASLTGDAVANNLGQIGGPVGFRAAGLFSGRVLASTANPIAQDITSSGQSATFQMRVWDNKGGTITTWAAALTAWNAGQTAIGWSPLFAITGLGGFGVPPGTPPNLVGLQSFQLTTVPEPSVIALGALGAGCLLFLRRRK
jgi:hypothetical protein